MSGAARERAAVAVILSIGAVVLLTGIGWGLPTREADRYLFAGAGAAWDGKAIIEKGGELQVDVHRGADQDASPVAAGEVGLNETERDRAQVVRRYRLFSNHPDEMVTFMALAGMRGGLDPRLYQYGGLWMYPVGGLLKVGGMIGAVRVTPDLAHYLNRPEDFGRFYIVARAYSAAWGLVGVWAVYAIARRVAGGLILPACAGICFALMPVVVNGAHEAKPHLAGTVLVLLAALAGARYVERGRARDALLAGAVAGAAVGMVLWAVVALLVLPAMALLRREAWPRRVGVTVLTLGVAVGVYCLTNPYVPINLLSNPEVLRSNLGALAKAKAIVGRATDRPAAAVAATLVADGGSPGVAVGGALAVIGLLAGVARRGGVGADRRGWTMLALLAVPCAVVGIQFVALAGGKTGEFGRFAGVVDVGLLVVLVAGAGVVTRGRGRVAAGLAMVAMTAPFGASYLMGFVADARFADSTRGRAAAVLATVAKSADGPLVLAARGEPAPYNVPPVDLGRWRVVLAGRSEGAAVIVGPVDAAGEARMEGAYVRRTILPRGAWFANQISWADKPIELLIRKDLAGAVGGE